MDGNKNKQAGTHIAERVIPWVTFTQRKTFFVNLRASLDMLFWVSILIPATVLCTLVIMLIDMEKQNGLLGIGVMSVVVIAVLYRMVLTIKASNLYHFLDWKFTGSALPTEYVKLKTTGLGIMVLLVFLSKWLGFSIDVVPLVATFIIVGLMVLWERTLMLDLAMRLKTARVVCEHWKEHAELYADHVSENSIDEAAWERSDRVLRDSYHKTI
jgi:hypothetical protein